MVTTVTEPVDGGGLPLADHAAALAAKVSPSGAASLCVELRNVLVPLQTQIAVDRLSNVSASARPHVYAYTEKLLERLFALASALGARARSQEPCGALGTDWRCARPAARIVNGEPRCATCGPLGHDPYNRAKAVIGELPARVNLSARTKEIADSIRHVRLDGVDGAVEDLCTRIIDLVLEATDGAPKPVLPPHNPELETPWEGHGFGIFRTEADDGPELVFFGSDGEESARRELRRRQALPDTHDDWMSADWCVLRCVTAMTYWNSLDKDPRESIRVVSATEGGGT